MKMTENRASANVWWRVYPPEDGDVDTEGFDERSGPRNMSERNAPPVTYFYMLFPMTLMMEFARQTNK